MLRLREAPFVVPRDYVEQYGVANCAATACAAVKSAATLFRRW